MPPTAGAPSLVVFGDSWASNADCWPELLAARFGWKCINVAAAYSSSEHLISQFHTFEMLHDEDEKASVVMAVIHTGGNDLYHCGPLALASVAVYGTCCCCGPLAQLYEPGVVRGLASNVATLVDLLSDAGVRRVVIAGVPLTSSMPYIANGARALPGGVAAAASIMRRCNALFLASLRRRVSNAKRTQPLDLVVCLDEALAIDQVVDGPNGPNEAWWDDVSHPSEALHMELAKIFARQIQGEVKPLASAAGAGSDESDPMLTFLTTTTPSERDVMSGCER